jgi:hypothetical protein
MRLGPFHGGVRPEPVILVMVPLFLAALWAGKAAGGVGISTGEFLVIAVRMLVPLLILRFWLLGGIAAMLADAADVILIELIGLGGFGDNYEQTDKLLDSYYYVLELVVALRWANQWLRRPAVILFVYRIVGAVLFEMLGARVLLIIFPNLFENWWLYCVVVLKWFPAIVPGNWRSTIIPMLLLLVPKLAQEYLLHVLEAEPWDWTKRNLLEPIGIDI